MTYPYRCVRTGCRKRVTLKHTLEWYIRLKKCPVCRKDSLKPARDMMRRKRDKALTCMCDGYHFPHRGGSKWCEDYKGVLTDDDKKER